MSNHDPPLPRIDGYRELATIGSGGFSRVYEAHQTKFGRRVAVKVLNFGLLDETDRRRFERETQVMGRVSAHPNIVTVYDTAFTELGHPCLVMELYAGGSLADLVNKTGPVDARETIDIGIAIASALEASHEAGVLHCDLKPQNILISDFGQPALGDFGISTFAEEHTRTGNEAGAGFTLHYAAPEIIEGESPSSSTDVYSLAATLYAVVAGRQPFARQGERASATELARRVLLDDVPTLTDRGVPEPLDHLLRRAMAKLPEHRPRSAGEFAEQLYRVGVELGFATRQPSTRSWTGGTEPEPTADALASTSVVAPRATPQDPFGASSTPSVSVEGVRSPLLEDSDTVGRDEAPVEIEAAPEPDEPTGPGRRRQTLAIIAALIALIAAAAIIWFGTRGGDEPVAVDTPPAAAPEDPVRAPTPPTGVRIERVGVTGINVSWNGQDDPSITYRVQRTDVEADALEVRGVGQVELTGISSLDAPCVVVVAQRGNRVANPTDPVCLGPKTGGGVDVRPATCERSSCQVRVVLDEYPANSAVSVLVLDPSGDDVNGFGQIYDTRVDTDDRGRIDEWRLDLPPLLPVGRYLVIVADDVGEEFSAPFEVVE